jgi:hypothetical protein
MEIRDIKQRLSILQVLSHYHLKPDRNNLIKCQFHEDDKPSCRIYADTNTLAQVCRDSNQKGTCTFNLSS